jgi:DNA primase
MIDQSMINLIDLIPTALKKVGQTGGGEYHGPCPFCGGTDRFIVQPHKTPNGGLWFCRQCSRHGDALAFVCDYEDLTISEGLKRLNLITSQPLKRQKPKEQPVVYAADLDCDKYLCFNPAWQAAAKRFMVDCELALINGWHVSNAGRYLEGRGINRKTAQRAVMGVNLADYRSTWGDASVWLPRGIVIPWTIDGQLWNVRVRRPIVDVEKSGGDKYISPKGSCGYAMYGIDDVQPGDTVVMTEGEFDAQLLRRFLRDQVRVNVSVVSIGSNTGARLGKWTYRLSVARKIYLAFDNDSAGDNASMWWSQALGRKAVRIRPSQKDITEMYIHGELYQFLKEIQ